MCFERWQGVCVSRQVLDVYKGRKWAFIEEHIHDVLGKHSRDAGCAAMRTEPACFAHASLLHGQA